MCRILGDTHAMLLQESSPILRRKDFPENRRHSHLCRCVSAPGRIHIECSSMAGLSSDLCVMASTASYVVDDPLSTLAGGDVDGRENPGQCIHICSRCWWQLNVLCAKR